LENESRSIFNNEILVSKYQSTNIYINIKPNRLELMPTTTSIISEMRSETTSKILKDILFLRKAACMTMARWARGPKESPNVTSLTDIDLHALAEVEDEGDTFLTVYFGTTGRDSHQSFVASRLSAIQKALPKDRKVAFEETLDMVEHALSALQ